jgi:hypothetical protein
VILVCAATGVEARACRRGIREASAEARFEVLVTGIGGRAARAALDARLALDTPARPSAIVSAGFAGAADPGLAVGGWTVAAEVAREGEGRLTAPPAWVHALAARLEARPVRCLTVDALRTPPFPDPEDAGGPGILPRIVDMESYPLAVAAAQAGIPFVCCRVVSDTPAQPLPLALGHFTQAMLGGGARSRLRHAGRGAAEALGDPLSLGRYLATARRLPRALAEGWSVIAQRDRSHGMLPFPWNDDPEAMSALSTRRSARTSWP